MGPSRRWCLYQATHSSVTNIIAALACQRARRCICCALPPIDGLGQSVIITAEKRLDISRSQTFN